MKWLVEDRVLKTSFSARSVSEIISFVSFVDLDSVIKIRDEIIRSGTFINDRWYIVRSIT